jgi:Na+/alanine symporter
LEHPYAQYSYQSSLFLLARSVIVVVMLFFAFQAITALVIKKTDSVFLFARSADGRDIFAAVLVRAPVLTMLATACVTVPEEVFTLTRRRRE